jgi:predicted amidohydrolase YtcJ
MPPKHETCDLQGAGVIPGLIDSHAHVLHEGLRLGQLDLHGLSRREAAEKVASLAGTLAPGVWIHGRGWDQNIWADRSWPTAEELDKAAPFNPVVLDRVDKHSIWVNSLALDRADPKVQGPAPEGGEILRRPDGGLLGILIGQAMFLVYKNMPPLDGRDRLATQTAAQEELLSLGLTTVMDCATSDEDLKVLAAAYGAGQLKLRYRAYIHPLRWRDWDLLKPADGLFGGRLAVDGLKLFSDGSLGSRSAWLLDEYADRSGHFGSHNYDDQGLIEMLKLAKSRRLQVAIHVIGDAAVAQAVRCMAGVLGPECPERHWRLEHCQVVTETDRDRILELGLIPSVQSAGLMTDLLMAEDRLGPVRLQRAYAWREFIDRGGYIINGSDCPVETANPFHGIYAAVTRQKLDGQPPEGFLPAHRLSRWEALAGYTSWGALAAFQEKNIGTLKAGAFCDLAVLDRDVMTCSEPDLSRIKVLKTVIGGETVFDGGF